MHTYCTIYTYFKSPLTAIFITFSYLLYAFESKVCRQRELPTKTTLNSIIYAFILKLPYPENGI